MVCPTCGAAQYEPRLVVSTFCKKCGVHLSIQKGKVTASGVSRAGGRVDNSAWDTAPAAPKPTAEASKSGSGWLPVSPPARNGSGNLKPIQVHPESSASEPVSEVSDFVKPVSKEEQEEGGFGVFLKQQVAPETTTEPEEETRPVETKPESDPPAVQERDTGVIRRPQSNSPPPTPAPEPMSASTLQKMRDQGAYRNAYFKDADCFDCGHKFKVGRSSRSANCPQCGSYISMEDVEINMHSTQPIKTRGDVLIRKRGHLSTDTVVCRDLRCQGMVEANIQASGDAAFRTVGNIIGEVRCKRFLVEKGADVTFLNLIHADEAEIHAKITGTIVCTGLLTIGRDGAVYGDVTARSVNIEPGGELNGAMNIVRAQAMPKPTLG